jgi:hypothetical protein
MPPQKQRAASWAACKSTIAAWPLPGVIELVHELYQLSDDNRRFLHARLLEHLGDSNLEDARRKIRKLMNPTAVFNSRFRHGDVKRVIDHYARATGDDAGIAGLLVADIEASLETFSECADDERIADHVLTSVERLHKTLERVAPDDARPVVDALAHIANDFAGEFGYGVSDEVEGLASEWQDRLAPRDTP